MENKSLFFLFFTGVLFFAGTAGAVPADQEVYTSFEGIISSDFLIGLLPKHVQFKGGFANVANNDDQYRTGTYGWMINAGETGTIEFGRAVQVVEFFARTSSTALGPGVLTSYSPAGKEITSRTITAQEGWVHVLFTGPLKKITFENQDQNEMTAVDDFGYSVVPEPSTIAILAVGAFLALQTKSTGKTSTKKTNRANSF